MVTSDSTASATIARRLRTQRDACEKLGSPLYAYLLERAALDVEAAGPVATVLEGREHDPGPSALALRLLGGVHRLVLTGRAPALARFYASVGGDAARGDPWPAFLATVSENRSELRSALDRPVQTNEVGRSGALIGGFLMVSAEFGLPLRLLEMGASAGLNLRWDGFHYQAGEASWGDPDSPVQLGDPYEGGAPPFEVGAVVIERRGCDRHPVDPTTEDGCLTLKSFAWPDMARRFADLSGALAVARRLPAVVDRAEAPRWLASQLGHGAPGVATVVFHSVVMQYLSEPDRSSVTDSIQRAGGSATRGAPFAWLRMEPANRMFDVRLTMWPGGAERLLATTEGHGRPVRWLAA